MFDLAIDLDALLTHCISLPSRRIGNLELTVLHADKRGLKRQAGHLRGGPLA
jgi:hypothetical protein